MATSNEVLEQFMASHKYAIPVLRGSYDYMTAAGLEDATPTTLFVDPQGNLVFKKLGGSAHLVQEFDWRLQAMAKVQGTGHRVQAAGAEKTGTR